MKKLIYSALIFAGLAASGCDDKKDDVKPADTVSFMGELKGSNQVPAVATQASGNVTATFDKGTNLLTYTVTYANLSGPATLGHFHLGAPGVVGGPFVTFAKLDSPITGTATLTSDQREALLAGNVYANIHTNANKAGEIRVNIAPANIMIVTGTLSGNNQVPAVATAGKGTVGATFNKDTKVLTYTISYSDLTGPATLGHFHIGAPGVVGPVTVDFGKTLASPITGAATLNAAQADELLKGNFYANLHTAMYRQGEIRANVTAK